jgi:hypothetical protein
MKKMQFTVDIHASKEKVWSVLWEDKTFREWSNLIDEGTFMRGEMVEGGTIQFISGNSGYGVTSLIEKLIPYEFVLLRHTADTQDNGENHRDQEWTGGGESYRVIEKGDVTELRVEFDVPLEQEETFQRVYPEALARIKVLAEGL